MALTDKQVYDLNNMNKAAQNAELGTLLKNGASPQGRVYEPSAATVNKPGLVKKASAVPGAAGETVTKEEFQALLDALKAAGIMA